MNKQQKNYIKAVVGFVLAAIILCAGIMTALYLMREEKGMSVRKLADLMEFESVQAVYNWQNGISLPSIINLKILSELFNKSMDDILVFE